LSQLFTIFVTHLYLIMSISIAKQLEHKINKSPKGQVFFISDFYRLGPDTAIRQALQRLTKKEVLMRLANGIYYYPRQDTVLGIVLPTAEQIAQAIAQRDKARIIPTGSYALYKLGLSTQIPMNVVYLTDGSARKIVVGNQKISFKKTSPKNLAVTHLLSNLIIQGLKALDQKKITEEIVQKIKTIILKSGEQGLIKENLKYAPARIRNLVLLILYQIENGELA